VLSAAGFPLVTFHASRQVSLVGPLNMSMSPITALGDATAATDALNRQSGDARYLQLTAGGTVVGPLRLNNPPLIGADVTTKTYVDQVASAARSQTVVFDVPEDKIIPGDGAWTEVASVPFIMARSGLSKIAVIISCNLRGINNVAGVGVRLGPGGAERAVFAFGNPGPTPPPMSSGFTVELYSDVSTGSMTVPVQLCWLPLGAAAPFTILGGSGPERSQVCVMDLGPA
jgi:hypothetical protein